MIATDTDVTARHDAAFPFHAGAFEARLGPHAYRIPAHCFRDQSGPDVDGSACLLLQWPALEPATTTRSGSGNRSRAAASTVEAFVKPTCWIVTPPP